jgi:hypothetical protein
VRRIRLPHILGPANAAQRHPSGRRRSRHPNHSRTFYEHIDFLDP